jgi:eukaryotic-like serine/threonine-protein kinase
MNRYKIKRDLGNGRLGQVYLAEDKVVGRDVILRQFAIPKGEGRSEFEKNFLSLVKDLSSIEDSSVLPVLDAGIESDTAFIVGASVKGDTIKSFLGKGVFSFKDVYQLSEQLLEALGKLREYGFFHYHFRLSSVLVQPKANGEKHFLLMDLGYSRLMPLIHGENAERTMICPAFAAPELCDGDTKGEITSLFMIGHLCYAVLAEGHPLGKLPLDVALAKHRVGELPYISGFRGDIPEVFRDWMYKLMSPNWKDRPQSIKEALEQMPSESEFSGGGSSVLTKPVSFSKSPER